MNKWNKHIGRISVITTLAFGIFLHATRLIDRSVFEELFTLSSTQNLKTGV